MSGRSDTITLTAAEAAALRRGFKYCPRCRAEMTEQEAYGRLRRVCPDCHFVQFIDPKVGAAVMVEQDERILLVKRAMDPDRGSWCFPGGFMDVGETPQEAAIRECKEESGIDIEISGLVNVFYYEDYRGSGVLIMYTGIVIGGQAQPGDDADAVHFFGPNELPDNIAFESNREALTAWRKGKQSNE